MRKEARTQKLRINRETLAVLHAPTLQEVNGAVTPAIPATIALSFAYCEDVYDYFTSK
jgi:hypothetical protein